jgi:hypothetical protein
MTRIGDSPVLVSFLRRARSEPTLPRRFGWHDESLVVAEVRRTWRSTTTDRGGQARWWLYTIGDAGS